MVEAEGRLRSPKCCCHKSLPKLEHLLDVGVDICEDLKVTLTDDQALIEERKCQ